MSARRGRKPEERIRRNIVVDRIAEAEGVEVADTEIDEQFNQLYGGRRMRRQERRAARQQLAGSIRIEKTLDLIVSIAKGEGDEQQQAERDESPTDASPIDDKEEGPDHDDSQA